MNELKLLRFNSIYEPDPTHGISFYWLGGFPFWCLDSGKTIKKETEDQIEEFFKQVGGFWVHIDIDNAFIL